MTIFQALFLLKYGKHFCLEVSCKPLRVVMLFEGKEFCFRFSFATEHTKLMRRNSCTLRNEILFFIKNILGNLINLSMNEGSSLCDVKVVKRYDVYLLVETRKTFNH